MKDLLQKSIEHLREHVLHNLEKVKENEKDIRELLKCPISISRNQLLTGKYEVSRMILAENNDFINMQLTLLNFINKYRPVIEPEGVLEGVHNHSIAAPLTKEECFQMTVESRIEFGPSHPFFADEDFISNLVGFYQQQENYEKCAEIINMRK
jgi:hypothetical protein